MSFLKGEALTEALHAAAACLAKRDAAGSLDSILTKTPKALADCPASILSQLRIATGLMHLTGTNTVRKFITVPEGYGYRRAPDSVALMLSFHASFLLTLQQARDVGFASVRSLGSGLSGECPACKAASREVFPIDQVPELPHTECTCADYCRCVLIVVPTP
jgi:hypothetical protein